MVSSRYGVDTRGFNFGRLPKEYDGMDTQAFKGELGSMRDVLGEIQSDMYKSLEKNKPAFKLLSFFITPARQHPDLFCRGVRHLAYQLIHRVGGAFLLYLLCPQGI